MSARLVEREYVPSGFEIVIQKEQICPGSSGGIWNLWWNVLLTDDPESWDDEIRRINDMQDRLEQLSTDQRLIRMQMAEFCRIHPSFPGGIDILCQEIGCGSFFEPVKLGCEGRGLLDLLGYHDQPSLEEQKQEILSAYARALKKWLEGGRPQLPIEYKVYGFLGQRVDAKEFFVEKLLSTIDPEDLCISALRALAEDQCLETHGRSVFEIGGHPLNCFECEDCTAGASHASCLCSYAMFLDTGLLCAATGGEARSIFGDFSRFTEENILAYSLAIRSWLQDAPPKPVTALIDARYFAEDPALELVAGVHLSLGEIDETKEWLAACLLKTIRDSQRWHRRSELIDAFPEAGTWFRGSRSS